MPVKRKNIAVPPSKEVRDEAYNRAIDIAKGLFPHQVEGVAFLLGRRRAILADDMGLGKTRQAVIALTEAEPKGPYLVVCPASVKRNWAREIEMARPGSSTFIVGPQPPPTNGYQGWVIVNYDVLKGHIADLLKHEWAGVIFDEAHYIKNHTSQRSKLGRQIVDQTEGEPVIYALTGTPLTNRPRDIFPLLQLVKHPLGKSFYVFAKRYCAAYDNGYGLVTDGASNLQELTVQLHGVMLRRNKDQVLNLPPKLRTYLDVDVPEGTASLEVRKALEILIESRLAQAAGRPSARGNDRTRLIASLTTARRKLAVAKAKQTIEFVQGAVDQGEKVLVFSCFDEPLKKIHQHFDGSSVLLTGATPSGRRQKLVDQFQQDDKVRVFVANIQAGGIGLNLTAARQVVFNDLDWVPANHWQAEDRAYRIGQTGCVTVTYMIGLESVDEFVKTVLETKAALVGAVIEGKALTGEIGGDILSELENLLSKISPQLADTPPEKRRGDWVIQVLRQANALYRESHAGDGNGSESTVAKPVLSEEALAILAKVLGGPKSTKYRVVSSSKPGQFYEIEASGPDLICSCPGFEYRGTCNHARKLKEALVAGKALPEGYSAAEG